MTINSLKALVSTFKNHCKSLHNDKIVDIKYRKMQDIIDQSKLCESGKKSIRTVCVKVFNCAIDDYELPLKQNPAIRLRVPTEHSDKNFPFSYEETDILWKKYNQMDSIEESEVIKILIILCYTGMRPNELFTVKRQNVFIKDNYLIGGLKTVAGKNRAIPIHSRIKPLVEYFINKNEDEHPFRLSIEKFNYGKFYRRYEKVMDKIEIKKHTPYDLRHTFATRMKQLDVNEYILKLIMGHSVRDTTERYYTHREIQDLLNEVEKLP